MNYGQFLKKLKKYCINKKIKNEATRETTKKKKKTTRKYTKREEVLETNDPQLISDWRYLTTSDHSYSMCTKYWHDGDVHAYFSAYSSPYEAFMYFMNVLRDIEYRIKR